MARKEAPEPTLEEILQMADEVALSLYPNPDRVGCPDEETLQRFARNPKSFPLRDPIFRHLGRCSPCSRFVRDHRRGQS